MSTVCDVVSAGVMGQGRQAVGEIRKPVKVLLVLVRDVTMVLNLVVSSDTVSPASSSRTAEPEVTR